MAGAMLIVGGIVFILMGLVHGLLSVADVFRPTQFAPRDDAVRVAMRSTTVRFLRARASMWDAWLGFSISHGLGMLMFGCAVAWLGLRLGQLDVSRGLLAVAAGIGLVYFILSLRFWFYAPAVASGIATACFVVAWWAWR